jgi:hypothetical protein
MTAISRLLTVFGLFHFALTQSILLPNITGRYVVGTISVEFNDVPSKRDIMTSFFYPAKHRGQYPLAPVFPPLYAQFQDQLYGLPPNTSSLVISQAHNGAPINNHDFPLLFFSTGYGSPRLFYTAAAEDLASEGYFVITIDHPSDSPFIEYPDGRGVAFNPPQFGKIEDAIPFVERRVSDIRFILDQLSNSSVTQHIPGLGRRHLDTKHVGILGHSLGGAAAAATMLEDTRFIVGADLDGAIVGAVESKGLDKPFLLMLAKNHTRESDQTLADFWSNLRGYKRQLSINGTEHNSYSDILVLVNILAELGLPLPNINTGTIGGTRMLQIQTAYLTSFFDRFLKDGKGRLLEGPNLKYPEVQFTE